MATKPLRPKRMTVPANYRDLLSTVVDSLPLKKVIVRTRLAGASTPHKGSKKTGG